MVSHIHYNLNANEDFVISFASKVITSFIHNHLHAFISLLENIEKKNRSRFPIAVLLTTLICSH